MCDESASSYQNARLRPLWVLIVEKYGEWDAIIETRIETLKPSLYNLSRVPLFHHSSDHQRGPQPLVHGWISLSMFPACPAPDSSWILNFGQPRDQSLA
jgi:hypothetical protein